MSRLQTVTPPYSREVEARLKSVTPAGASPLLLFRALAANDRAWNKMTGGNLLDPGPLNLRDREIVIDRTCALAGCEYEWGVHVAFFGRRAGLTAEEIDATVRGSAHSPCWSPSERALISTCDALHHRARLDEAEFELLRAHYQADQILEIIQLCGFYRTIAYMVGTLDLPLEAGAARFPH